MFEKICFEIDVTSKQLINSKMMQKPGSHFSWTAKHLQKLLWWISSPQSAANHVQPWLEDISE